MNVSLESNVSSDVNAERERIYYLNVGVGLQTSLQGDELMAIYMSRCSIPQLNTRIVTQHKYAIVRLTNAFHMVRDSP